MSSSHVCGFIATIRSVPPRRPSQPASLTRTSYHVGRPWILDGKMLRGLTGTPMRRMHLANSSLADAEPEPLMFANFTTKSLVAVIGFMSATIHRPRRPRAGRGPVVSIAQRHWIPAFAGMTSQEIPHPASRRHLLARRVRRVILTPSRIRFREQESPHVPCAGRATFGAQAAVQANVLVLHHHPAGLDGFRYIQILLDVFRGRGQA